MDRLTMPNLDFTRASVMPGGGDMPMEGMMDSINKQAKKPMMMEDVAIFRGLISNQTVDDHATRMDATTLSNYAHDFAEGRAIMNSHRDGGFLSDAELPLGRSFAAQMVGDPMPPDAGREARGGAATRIWFYLVRGLTLNGQPTNDVIAAMDAGVINDLSVGFSNRDGNGYYRCSECGNDMFRSEDCTHFPNQMVNGHRAFAWVMNMRAEEGSLVYRGSNPDAAIEKAVRMLGAPSLKKGKRMEWDKVIADMRAVSVPLADQIAGAKDDDSRIALLVDAYHTAHQTAISAAARFAADVEKMKVRAALGDEYMHDLVEEAVAARTRAQADKFDATKYRAVLVASGDIEFIKAEIKSYGEQTRLVLGSGARPTVEAQKEAAKSVDRASSASYR